MTDIETVIEITKNPPGINEVTVMSDIAEYWAKQKLWNREIIWKVISNISLSVICHIFPLTHKVYNL